MFGTTDGFKGVPDGYGIGKRNVEQRRLVEFYDEKELCVQTHGLKRRSRKNNINYRWK